MSEVHALLTDVTGFGLLGHLLEICRGSGLGVEVKFAQVPVLSEALPLAQQGVGPGAIERNLASYGHNDFPKFRGNRLTRMSVHLHFFWQFFRKT